MDAPATPLPFRVATDGRQGRIEVDGTDITAAVNGATLQVGYGEPSALTLELVAGQEGVLDGVAIVKVVSAAASADAVRSLALEEVQGRVAARPVDLSTNLIETVLDVVAELLDEMAT